jgi:hypothetical protein
MRNEGIIDSIINHAGIKDRKKAEEALGAVLHGLSGGAATLQPQSVPFPPTPHDLTPPVAAAGGSNPQPLSVPFPPTPHDLTQRAAASGASNPQPLSVPFPPTPHDVTQVQQRIRDQFGASAEQARTVVAVVLAGVLEQLSEIAHELGVRTSFEYRP